MNMTVMGRGPRRIAVIGGGISGMGAAHALSTDHHVTLFEAEGRLGGHARTMPAGPKGEELVDTGFLVFNYANYPQLTALFDALDVPVTESSMSFGASFGGGAFEYALNSLDTVFAQRRNLVSPGYWRMCRDVWRFMDKGLQAAQEDGLTIADFLQKLNLGDRFRDQFLLPFSGAIWSTPKEKILDFAAATMMDFFANHALLGITGQHQWFTVKGGSVQYVTRLRDAMLRQNVDIRLGAPIQGVRRSPIGAEVRAHGGEWERFDEVIFATHSDDSLSMLADATGPERDALGAIRYQPNSVVLHSDPAAMPKRRKVWSSWNYTEPKDFDGGPIDLTYWLNSLQPWITSGDYFVTLNARMPIREELIWDTCELRHPVYDFAAQAGKEVIASINGLNNTWFCGAWMKNGFHEDGLSSALDVATAINAAPVRELAAE